MNEQTAHTSTMATISSAKELSEVSISREARKGSASRRCWATSPQAGSCIDFLRHSPVGQRYVTVNVAVRIHEWGRMRHGDATYHGTTYSNCFLAFSRSSSGPEKCCPRSTSANRTVTPPPLEPDETAAAPLPLLADQVG